MTVTTTETTETTGTTKLERLEGQQQRLFEREQELLLFLRDSPDREAEARAAWFAEHPTKLPDATSPAGKEAAKAAKAKTELDTIAKNLSALAALLEAERAKQREFLTRRIGKQAEEFRDAERDAVRRAAETFTKLAEDFAAYRTAAEALNSWREAAAAEAGLAGTDLEDWRTSEGRHAVEPIPVDLISFVQMFLDVCLDVFGYGHRTDISRSWDSGRELTRLTPDLRHLAHEVVDVQRVERRTSMKPHLTAGGGWGG